MPTTWVPVATVLRAALLGVAVGLPILGVGGRLVMRGIAMETDAPGGFTLGGTLAVLVSGLGSGALGGAIRGVLEIVKTLTATARAALFTLACALLTWRGLNPVDATKVKWFAPIVLLFVIVLEWRWRAKQHLAGSPG